MQWGILGRRVAAGCVGLAALLLVGCGSVPTTAARPVAHPHRAPVQHHVQAEPPIPSVAVMSRELLPGWPIDRLVVFHWADAAPEVLVVMGPQFAAHQLPNLQLAAIQWDPATHQWHNTWRGPDMGVEPPSDLMGAPLYRVTVSKLTTDGAMVGLLSTNDTGDAIDSGAALVWVPIRGTPTLLTTKALANASLRDATIDATPHGIMVKQAVCADGGWYARFRGAQLPTVSHLNCAQTVERVAGTALRFTVAPGTDRVVTATATLTVSVGTTVVFRPGNAYTAGLMNSGAIVPLGQQGLPVYDDEADMLHTWAWTFLSPGTYGFTVMTAKTGQLSSGGVPTTWVVHVRS